MVSIDDLIKLFFNKHRFLSRKDSFLFDNLSKDDIAIDCGANIGKITKEMAKHGARVFAFEPNPAAFEVLCQNINSYPNVECINKGVLDKNTTLKLYKHIKASDDEVLWSQGSSIISTKGNITTKDYYLIEVIDLCEFITSLHTKVKLLKIDIEGAECEVLDAMINKGIYKNVDLTLVETHDHKIPELRKKMESIRSKINKKGIRNIVLDWM